MEPRKRIGLIADFGQLMKTLLPVVLLLAFPLVAGACPMCQGGTTGGSILANRGTTIFLVLLPFLTGWLIYRYIKKEMMEP